MIQIFRDMGPDVKNNPLPAYGVVNSIKELSDGCVIEDVEDIKTPLLFFHA